jgi:predicted nucleic acid-binding protein
VFLRFFTQDDEGQHQRAAGLFLEAAAGEIELASGPPVLFEVAWTMRAAYGQPNGTILDALSAIRTLSGLRLTDDEMVGEAIALARRTDQEFADAYILVSARRVHADAIATFNRKHFERLGAEIHCF